jgi:hypothetical protein
VKKLVVCLSFLLPVLLTSSFSAAAQRDTPLSQASGAIQITLGQSVAPLNGPWKFQIGDSPIDPATGKPLWAGPGFDDTSWEAMDLTPQPGVVDPWNGDSRWVPGWTAKGHPGYMGWAWYRLRVRVAAAPGERLAVSAPLQATDAYQFFANGELIGKLGKFDSGGRLLAAYFPLPEMFSVPASTWEESPGTAVRTATFAYRVWLGRTGMTFDILPGGIHYAPLLVSSSGLEAQRKLDWNEVILANIYPCFEGTVFLLLALLAASILLFDRSDPVYLWVAGVLIVSFSADAFQTVMNFTHRLDASVFFLINVAILRPLSMGMWAIVWWVWFQLRRPAWVPKTIAALTLLCITIYALAAPISYNYLPHPVWSTIGASAVFVRMAFVVLFLLIFCLGIRKEGKEGWLVLAAGLPMAIQLFGPEVARTGLDVGAVVHPFGITFFLNSVGSLFLLAALALLMLRRLLRSLKRQRQMALDVKQAQEVQQVILPQRHSFFPGLEIESEYRPAREVGGDFFQIIPDETDGCVLIVAGDVTGKGLKAGMLVALLVGAIRSTVEMTTEPIGILQALNRRLLGRGDAQATCLALRVEKDGSATLANAGHIAPYLNGEPMAMEGALPLGMVEGAEFSVMHFKLNERDRLMLMSDGIAEATDANGKLFGFERVHDLLRASGSASDVATAAQKFGQEDDISVIAVRCTAKLSPALV